MQSNLQVSESFSYFCWQGSEAKF